MKRAIAVILAMAMTCLNIGPAYADSISIPIGTPVTISLLEELSSKTASIGQRVQFIVESDVKVKGVLVFKKHAPAIGEVTGVSAAGMVGVAGSLTVSLRQVQAVDGTMVAISSTKGGKGKSKLASTIAISVLCCVFALFRKGKNVEFKAGSLYNAYTLGTVQVDTK